MMGNCTVVTRWSRTQASHALSTAEAEYYVDRLGTECAGSCLDRLQRSQSDCFEKRTWKDPTYRIETPMTAKMNLVPGEQISQTT